MDDILTSEDLRLLADIGFIAASRNLTKHATSIFESLSVLRPGQEVGYLGNGIVQIVNGEIDTAIDVLDKAPDTDAVRTFKGIAYAQQGDLRSASALLAEVEETAEDPVFSDLAKTIKESLAG